MISTTSVPAIYALSAVGFGMTMIVIYMGVIFLVLAGILFTLVYFSKRVKQLIFHSV